jgi:hypothetical protein
VDGWAWGGAVVLYLTMEKMVGTVKSPAVADGRPTAYMKCHPGSVQKHGGQRLVHFSAPVLHPEMRN